jgi:hypothetical protein
MEISRWELQEIINQTAETAAKLASIRTAEALGVCKTTVRRNEVEKIYGISIYRNSLNYVNWYKKGNAKNSPMIANRAEFESFLLKNEIELKHL